MMPITAAAHGGTKPAAGVIVTSPATEPVSAPTMLGFPLRIQSMIIQVIIASEAAISVLAKAIAANPLEPNALPPLNPNQPNHNKAAPSATYVTLCGKVLSPLLILRLPITRTDANAAKPALVCTTIPPAKSAKPICERKPPPQAQCAIGV